MFHLLRLTSHNFMLSFRYVSNPFQGAIFMISYKPLFHTLIEKGLTREQLRQRVKAAPSTFSRIYAGKLVQLDLIDRICRALDVPVSNVIESVEDVPPDKGAAR